MKFLLKLSRYLLFVSESLITSFVSSLMCLLITYLYTFPVLFNAVFTCSNSTASNAQRNELSHTSTKPVLAELWRNSVKIFLDLDLTTGPHEYKVRIINNKATFVEFCFHETDIKFYKTPTLVGNVSKHEMK
jgi:hypothetical protein